MTAIWIILGVASLCALLGGGSRRKGRWDHDEDWETEEEIEEEEWDEEEGV